MDPSPPSARDHCEDGHTGPEQTYCDVAWYARQLSKAAAASSYCRGCKDRLKEEEVDKEYRQPLGNAPFLRPVVQAYPGG